MPRKKRLKPLTQPYWDFSRQYRRHTADEDDGMPRWVIQCDISQYQVLNRSKATYTLSFHDKKVMTKKTVKLLKEYVEEQEGGSYPE